MMPLEGERPGLELIVRLEHCSHLHEAHIEHDPAGCPVCVSLPRAS